MPDDARAPTRELPPTPWTVSPTTSSNDRRIDAGQETIAKVYGHPDYGNAEAIANVMAVAPELLAVVKRTLSLFEAMDLDVDEVERLRALVERAEGK